MCVVTPGCVSSRISRPEVRSARTGLPELSGRGGSVATVREYREFAVPAELRGMVECGWRGSLGTAERPQQLRVLPDGCMDLIWTGRELVVAGPDTSAFVVTQTPASSSTALRFRPGVAPALLGVPAAALHNERAPLTEIAPALARTATELLDTAPSPAHALVGTVRWALADTGRPDPGLLWAARLLGTGRDVASTADALGWTPRSLHRRARDGFGYGPAVLRRVLRFRRAMRLAWQGVPAVEVAAESGYADQAHLAREIRALAGVPLGQLLADTASGANRSTEVSSGSRSTA